MIINCNYSLYQYKDVYHVTCKFDCASVYINIHFSGKVFTYSGHKLNTHEFIVYDGKRGQDFVCQLNIEPGDTTYDGWTLLKIDDEYPNVRMQIIDKEGSIYNIDSALFLARMLTAIEPRVKDFFNE